MAKESLPNIVTSLTDGNLNTRQVVDLGDRIILLGTAARGPMNEPRVINSVEDAERLYGDIEEGNLVRGYSEAFFAPGGAKDVRLVRVGTGLRADLEVPEALGSGIFQETIDSLTDIAETSVTILARDPGEIYNQGSVRQEVVDGQLSVIFYNPVTDLETVIPYDPAGLVANSVSDAEELVNALNLDTNFASNFEAKVNVLETTFTLNVAPSDTWVESAGNFTYPSGTITVDLAAALNLADTDNDDLTEDTGIVTVDTPVTAANHLKELVEVYSLEAVNEDLDAAGKSQVTLDNPVQTSGGVAVDFLMLDLTTDPTYDGRAKHVHAGAFIGTGDGESVTFEFTAYEPIDTSTLDVFRTGPSGTPIEVTGVAVNSIGGASNSNVASITLPAAPPLNHVLTASWTTLEFPLTKVTTLTAVKNSNSYRTYYVAGNKVFFGSAQPADLQIAYSAKKIFTEGAEVAIEDSENGTIVFQDLAKLPNIWLSGGVDIFMRIKYLPEFPNLSGGARSLSGGTNGITMTNAQKYDALATAYEALEDTPADIIVPVDTYIDDTKTDYDSETGVQGTVNAGFAEQLNAHCEQLLDGVSETFGVIGVKPIEPADGVSPKASDITSWITKLTEFSFSDVTRAANIMRNLDAKHLDVVAVEPVFSNPAIRVPYTANGASLYAGLIAKLKSHSAATNKPLTGIVGLRYPLSARQLNTLTANRFITAMNRPDLGVVITDGVTAAAVTSDWTRRSTFRIMVEAMRGVRRVGMPFIGEGFNGAKKAALDTAILRHLEGMKNEGKLKDFTWVITQTATQEVKGTASIKLVLTPAFELRRLEVTVELRQS